MDSRLIGAQLGSVPMTISEASRKADDPVDPLEFVQPILCDIGQQFLVHQETGGARSAQLLFGQPAVLRKRPITVPTQR